MSDLRLLISETRLTAPELKRDSFRRVSIYYDGKFLADIWGNLSDEVQICVAQPYSVDKRNDEFDLRIKSGKAKQ